MRIKSVRVPEPPPALEGFLDVVGHDPDIIKWILKVARDPLGHMKNKGEGHGDRQEGKDEESRTPKSEP